MRAGVIGTGAMGRSIAVNRLAAGHSVIVYIAHALEGMSC
jgi:3-hydroxyisobutyrate dehydrogenase-like beta-hydroxyacid dehydrogenase